MPRRKTNPHLIPGEIAQWERAEWRPLLETVGDLARSFMWMGELELADGTSVHAYKHRSTRRYLHLGADGRAFAYVPPARMDTSESGAYRPISLPEAIEEAFHDLEQLVEVAERDVVVEQVGLALQHAERGEPMPFDPEWLARQRRFERAAKAAWLHEADNRHHLDEARFDDGDQFYGDMTRIDEWAKPEPKAA